MAALVDTLEATRRLEEAGFATPQAEAIARTVIRSEARLATKGDIDRLEAATKEDIRGLRVELTAAINAKIADARTEIAALRAAMTSNMNRLPAALLALAGVLFAGLRM